MDGHWCVIVKSDIRRPTTGFLFIDGFEFVLEETKDG